MIVLKRYREMCVSARVQQSTASSGSGAVPSSGSGFEAPVLGPGGFCEVGPQDRLREVEGEVLSHLLSLFESSDSELEPDFDPG